MKKLAVLLLWGLVAFTARAADPQTFPEKSIRLIVPFAAGGTTDAIARIVAEKLAELLRQPVVVDNRPGAGGNTGTTSVAKASPDGYTLAMVGNSFTVNPALYPAMPFRQEELVPVVIAGSVPFVMVANPQAPFRTAAELVAYAKARPQQVTYASGGVGTIGHLGAHLFTQLAGVQMTHVAYRGGAPAMMDLLAGQVNVFFDTLVTSSPYIGTNKLRPLFVSSPKRLAALPEVPTAAQAGYPALTFSAWVGIVAPAATPTAVMHKLNAAANEALGDTRVRARLAAVGATPVGGSLREAGRFFAEETQRWTAVVRSSGAKLD